MQLFLNCKAYYLLIRPKTLTSKPTLAMKLLVTFLVAFSLQSSARSYSQGITLQLKNAPLEKVFKLIEEQTKFHFVYSQEAMKKAKPVSIEVSDERLENVLRLSFTDQPLAYSIQDNFVIIKVDENKKAVPAVAADIRGRVINENNEPLAGVTVTASKSNRATSTNHRGEFYLRDIDENDVLVVTSVGYHEQEIPVNDQTYFAIQLKIAVGSLDETIVIGYGTTTKRLNTGSVSKITSNDISTQPVSNPLAALEGRVPGLLISQANGLPGSNYTVRIRGQNSIQNGNSPLYIIDGVPFLNDVDALTQRSGINANSPFNTINPANIESIEVLKDADATAIYGSRGANGVILITTKKGKEGKTTLNINLYTGQSKITRAMSYLNTNQYLQMRHEALNNDGIMPDPSNAYDFLVWDSTRYTDLKKLLIGGTAHTDDINLRLSGGNPTTKFSLGGNYHRETTVFPGDNADTRTAIDLSLTHTLPSNKFSTSVSVSYASDKSNLVSQDLTQYINLPPTIPALFDSIGKLNWDVGGFAFDNPMSVLLQNYDVETDRLTANLVLNYTIMSHFHIKLNLGYNDINADEKTLYPISSQNPSYSPVGSSFFGISRFKNWIIEPQCSYNSPLGKKGEIQILIGTTWQHNLNKRSSTTAYGYTNDNLINSTIGAQSIVSENGHSLYKYGSIFGRVKYDWNKKYLIDFTGRRDGSSRFGPGKQFANFGATGIGWIFTKENFIHQAFPFLSFGKIRSSYGITGNDLIGDYQFLNTYSETRYPYQSQPSLFPSRLYNPNYSWEQIRKLDIAIELGFWKDRLLITSDWFINKSDNQIISYSLPGQTGFNSVLQNFPGVVQNKGIELSITSENIKTKNFEWTTSFNITTTKNMLLKFPNLESSSYANRYIINKSLNSIIGAVYAGVDPQTGIYQFLTKDKTLTSSPDQADYIYLGTTDPKYYGGIQNAVNYRNWEIDFLLEFRKQTGIDAIFSSYNIVGSAINEPAAVLDHWQKPGDISKFEMFTQTFTSAGSATFNLPNSSAVLTDASFCRLKNISLSYNLPSTLLEKIKMEKCRFFFEAHNLLTLTKYQGADPETQSLFALPQLRTIAAGLQVIF